MKTFRHELKFHQGFEQPEMKFSFHVKRVMKDCARGFKLEKQTD